MSQQKSLGIIHHDTGRHADFLYRISLKCLVQNALGEVLVVKEDGRTWWDLPGGGMDHGESFSAAIARELAEEVSLVGDFSYKIIDADEPAYLTSQDFWQIRLVFKVTPQNMAFSPGADADEVAFMNPASFKNSESSVEQRIYKYSVIAQK